MPPVAPAPRHPLPDYQHPPVVEVLLGATWLTPLEDPSGTSARLLRSLGAEWTSGASDYSGVSTLTNLLQDGRICLSPQSLMVQWGGFEGNRYPHYESLRDIFVAAWVGLQNGGRFPQAIAWTVKYVNRIPRGTVWQTPGDWSFCRLLAAPYVPSTVAELRRVSGLWHYPLPDERGELRIRLDCGDDEEAPPECLWLELTCAGSVADEETSLLDGLDFGRQTIVRTFRELMTPAANDYWGLQGRPTP